MKVSTGLKRGATLGVLKNGENFLLLKRIKEPNQGLYTTAGGKPESYESPLKAVSYFITRTDSGSPESHRKWSVPKTFYFQLTFVRQKTKTAC